MVVNTLKESADMLREKLNSSKTDGPQIKSTMDYSIFKKHPQNRELAKESKRFKQFVNAVKEDDLLSINPILVDKDLKVIDGQHRLEAARLLRRPIYYILYEPLSAKHMRVLNVNQKDWGSKEYLHHFANGGNLEYQRFIEFCEKETLSYRVGLELVFPQKRPQANRIMSGGNFEFPKGADLILVQKLTKAYHLIWNFFREKSVTTPRYLHQETFKMGIAKFLKSNPPDISLFLKRLEMKMSAFRSCSRAEHYAEQLEDIYNFGAKNKIDFSERDIAGEKQSPKSLM